MAETLLAAQQRHRHARRRRHFVVMTVQNNTPVAAAPATNSYQQYVERRSAEMESMVRVAKAALKEIKPPLATSTSAALPPPLPTVQQRNGKRTADAKPAHTKRTASSAPAERTTRLAVCSNPFDYVSAQNAAAATAASAASAPPLQFIACAFGPYRFQCVAERLVSQIRSSVAASASSQAALCDVLHRAFGDENGQFYWDPRIVYGIESSPPAAAAAAAAPPPADG